MHDTFVSLTRACLYKKPLHHRMQFGSLFPATMTPARLSRSCPSYPNHLDRPPAPISRSFGELRGLLWSR
jgi:hypothetical protein